MAVSLSCGRVRVREGVTVFVNVVVSKGLVLSVISHEFIAAYYTIVHLDYTVRGLYFLSRVVYKVNGIWISSPPQLGVTIVTPN